ncbi:unnamed protein product [Orchesella dallaii]|uniref:Uncharacterized protein n=1 Tax=Orchesella dallaii TaxID=48710 RepID=A0ABP1PSY1_9HEXA
MAENTCFFSKSTPEIVPDVIDLFSDDEEIYTTPPESFNHQQPLSTPPPPFVPPETQVFLEEQHQPTPIAVFNVGDEDPVSYNDYPSVDYETGLIIPDQVFPPSQTRSLGEPIYVNDISEMLEILSLDHKTEIDDLNQQLSSKQEELESEKKIVNVVSANYEEQVDYVSQLLAELKQVKSELEDTKLKLSNAEEELEAARRDVIKNLRKTKELEKRQEKEIDVLKAENDRLKKEAQKEAETPVVKANGVRLKGIQKTVHWLPTLAPVASSSGILRRKSVNSTKAVKKAVISVHANLEKKKSEPQQQQKPKAKGKKGTRAKPESESTKENVKAPAKPRRKKVIETEKIESNNQVNTIEDASGSGKHNEANQNAKIGTMKSHRRVNKPTLIQ